MHTSTHIYLIFCFKMYSLKSTTLIRNCFELLTFYCTVKDKNNKRTEIVIIGTDLTKFLARKTALLVGLTNGMQWVVSCHCKFQSLSLCLRTSTQILHYRKMHRHRHYLYNGRWQKRNVHKIPGAKMSFLNLLDMRKIKSVLGHAEISLFRFEARTTIRNTLFAIRKLK